MPPRFLASVVSSVLSFIVFTKINRGFVHVQNVLYQGFQLRCGLEKIRLLAKCSKSNDVTNIPSGERCSCGGGLKCQSIGIIGGACSIVSIFENRKNITISYEKVKMLQKRQLQSPCHEEERFDGDRIEGRF